MKLARFAAILAAATLTAAPALAELEMPSLVYRTGPYAPNGIPFANGYADYMTMLNERDGGVGGVKIKLTECETAYNTKQGVECYENTKGNGSLVYQPLSTGITYQLIPKATEDQIPIHSMLYGRTSAANGKLFPYVFNFPGTYWDAASILVKHAGDMEGGMDNLQGKKIALVYHNSAYGKEPIRTLEKLAEKHGYTLILLPVDHPGQEQKATWLQVRRERPDFVFMWGWGVMNQVAIKEAASIRFPMERFIGTWWSGSEADVLPAEGDAQGYKTISVHGASNDLPVHDDIRTHVYDKGLGGGERERIGEMGYNRGMVAAMWATEAIRNAQSIHNTKELTGAQMRDGYESLKVDNARYKELGMEGLTVEVAVSCENHGGPGKGAIFQWDASAKQWNQITEYMEADREVVDALIEEDSAAYAAENNITPRSCD
ncbi:MAG: ABC transporter substrate-binding protein [Pseudomonadota bacterium]